MAGMALGTGDTHASFGCPAVIVQTFLQTVPWFGLSAFEFYWLYKPMGSLG